MDVSNYLYLFIIEKVSDTGSVFGDSPRRETVILVGLCVMTDSLNSRLLFSLQIVAFCEQRGT